jgi:tetratricopeptide (TPR) repeat protein
MVELVPEGLHLSWTPVSGASHYTIFWGSEPGQYINCADASGHEVMITSPARGELYACAVTAWNARGESQYSKEALCVYDTDEHAAPKYLSKAKDLMGQGELEQAQAYLSAAIRLQPEKVEAYKLRASVYEKMHAFDLAKLDQEVAVKLSRRKTASLEVSTR